jgi:hypothetical protein
MEQEPAVVSSGDESSVNWGSSSWEEPDEESESPPEERTAVPVFFPIAAAHRTAVGIVSLPESAVADFGNQSSMLLRSRRLPNEFAGFTVLDALFSPHTGMAGVAGTVCIPSWANQYLRDRNCAFRFGAHQPSCSALYDEPLIPEIRGRVSGLHFDELDQDLLARKDEVRTERHGYHKDDDHQNVDTAEGVSDMCHEEIEEIQGRAQGGFFGSNGVLLSQGADQLKQPQEIVSKLAMAQSLFQGSGGTPAFKVNAHFQDNFASGLDSAVASLEPARATKATPPQTTLEARFPVYNGKAHVPFTLSGPTSALSDLAGKMFTVCFPTEETSPAKKKCGPRPYRHGGRCAVSLFQGDISRTREKTTRFGKPRRRDEGFHIPCVDAVRRGDQKRYLHGIQGAQEHDGSTFSNGERENQVPLEFPVTDEKSRGSLPSLTPSAVYLLGESLKSGKPKYQQAASACIESSGLAHGAERIAQDLESFSVYVSVLLDLGLNGSLFPAVVSVPINEVNFFAGQTLM